MTKEEILAKLAAGEMTVSQAMAEMAEIDRQVAAAAAKAAEKPLYCKAGEKGGVSIYNLQRFPVTLYKEQWDRLFDFIPELKAFLDANKDNLKTKEEAKAAKAAAAQKAA